MTGRAAAQPPFTVIGLTGSIGMGKSTVARMFADAGIPVADSDAIVHALYQGPAIPLIEAAFPGTTSAKAVDRQKLGERVLGDSAALAALESIIHPLVHAAQDAFVAKAKGDGASLALLDIPLLFESGTSHDLIDFVIVVSCSASRQRRRVLARPGMTEQKFAHILAKQMPDVEKRKRADLVIDTNGSLEATRDQVRTAVDLLRTQQEKRER